MANERAIADHLLTTPAEALADAILRAAGSGLKHYTEYSRKRIIAAAEQEIARVLSAHAHLTEQPK